MVQANDRVVRRSGSGTYRELIIVNDVVRRRETCSPPSPMTHARSSTSSTSKRREAMALVNIGIEASTGNVIALAASGDWVNPDKLARQHSAMENTGSTLSAVEQESSSPGAQNWR